MINLSRCNLFSHPLGWGKTCWGEELSESQLVGAGVCPSFTLALLGDLSCWKHAYVFKESVCNQ